MRRGARPSSSRRQGSDDGPANFSAISETDQSHYLTGSEIPSNVSDDQIFSLFIALAATVHTSESLGSSNALENLVNKDLGMSNVHTRYVGSGASFSVRAWQQEYPERSLALKSAMPSDYRFTDRDEKRRLADIILELRALTHPRLRGHRNIIELLGLAWETDSFDQLRKWPALVLEYADGGTLFDLLERKVLKGQDKLKVCLDIASGIAAIHGCGIVHGDLKPQNILMLYDDLTSGREGTWTAKIGDFGGAILDLHDGSLSSLRTPTQPWNAPEWDDKLSHFGLMQTDVYSLGLVFWSIAADGINPFTQYADAFGLVKYASNTRDRYLAIQKLKVEGCAFLQKLYKPGSDCFSHDIDAETFKHMLSLTVQPDPKHRSLSAVLTYLSNNLGLVNSPAGPAAEKDIQEMNVNYTPQETLEEVMARPNEVDTLDPAIRKYVVKRLEYTTASGSEEWQRSSAAFTLASEALDKENDLHSNAKCLSWLVLAAKMNHQLAQSLVYRFYTAFDVEIETSFVAKVKLWSSEAAFYGYLSAQEDLSLILSREECDEVKAKYRTRYAGIGRNRFSACYDENSLPVQEWDLKLSARIEEVLESGREAEAVRMNDQGDTILHFAASAGFLCTIIKWVSIRPNDINSRGQYGETPLLHVCRSGHYELAIFLLEAGADPRISSDNGDTPLHWILSFDNGRMKQIAAKLFEKNANPDAPAKRYSFVSAPDLDYEAGTPLHRAVRRGNVAAVRSLLGIGASAVNEGGRPDRYTPLNLAALLHYPEILEALLDSLPEPHAAGNIVGGMSLLIPAIKGEINHGRNFQKIARHGSLPSWWSRAKKCLDILLCRGAAEHLHKMPEKSIGFGSSALFIAIPYGDLKVIEYLLKQPGVQNDIETKCQLQPGYTPSTPLHRAITQRRIDNFKLLLCSGADVTTLHSDNNAIELTYLYECAASGHSNSDFAKLLISKGVKVDAGPALYETPFACAVRNRCFELASYLLQQGADPHVEFSSGFMLETDLPRNLMAFLIGEQSLSSLACLDYLFENVDKLGKYGKPHFITSKSRRTTVLHQIARTPEHGRDNLACKLILLRLLKFFHPSEAEINQFDVDGFTALTYAVIQGNVDVATVLLDGGASPLAESPDYPSSSPLYHLLGWLYMFSKPQDLEREIADKWNPTPIRTQVDTAKFRREEIRELFKAKVSSNDWINFRRESDKEK